MMRRTRDNQFAKSGMTVLCMVIFLFSYVNATMFWHGHSGSGYWVFHSHISGSSHRSAPVEAAHTSAELLLIQAVDQSSFTEDVIPVCDLAPQGMMMETVQTEPASTSGISSFWHIVLRGPPALV